MNLMWIISLSALIVIALLAGYAWQLVQKVKKNELEAEQQQQQEAEKAAYNLRKKQQELVNDIRFVARSVVEQQCEITEGVLRIHYLISGLDPDVWQMNELQNVRAHYDATKAMPILEAYKKLSRKQQFKLDSQRWSLEEKNKLTIEQELKWLVAYSFPQVTLLQ